jgi:methylated-DNA-[protein]-cysteine S-methyltransferase
MEPTTDQPLVAELSTLAPPPTASELTALRHRLVVAAERDGLVDVAYRVVDSPFGALLVAATAAGVVRVAFEAEGHRDVLADLAATLSPRVLESPARLDEAARQLEEYFAGRRRAFELAVDLRLARGFRRQVLEHLRTIDYGRTETYAQAAAGAGNPTAVRAAASACAHNPLPIVVPCHRIVRSDGTIGQYLAGTAVKAALLEMEAAA